MQTRDGQLVKVQYNTAKTMYLNKDYISKHTTRKTSSMFEAVGHLIDKLGTAVYKDAK